jgi:transaldolase
LTVKKEPGQRHGGASNKCGNPSIVQASKQNEHFFRMTNMQMKQGGKEKSDTGGQAKKDEDEFIGDRLVRVEGFCTGLVC